MFGLPQRSYSSVSYILWLPQGHFDGVIRRYRETHVTAWPDDMPELPPLIERLRSLHPGEETQTHILHLASDGVILVSMLSGPTAHMVANAHLPAAR